MNSNENIEENFERREPYSNCNIKKYNELEVFFSKVQEFTKNDNCEKIKNECPKNKNYRVWLLFGSIDNVEWKCLQVAHSKQNVESEINDVIDCIFYRNIKQEDVDFKNSAFYKKTIPLIKEADNRRKYIYSIIANKYNHFRICYLNVDKYLNISCSETSQNKNDMEKIIDICKNQYAEAKIAYETLSLYWCLYSSGIDGQTIAYIAENPTYFNN